MRAAILTLSDSGHAGAREDRSGPLIRALLEAAGYTVVHTALLPDGRDGTNDLTFMCLAAGSLWPVNSAACATATWPTSF